MVIPCSPVSGTGSGSGSGSVCTTPCTCTFADDGIRELNGSYVVNTGEGRRNTVVDGEGTVEDPYTISFIDSEFFRPDVGEFTHPNQAVPNNVYAMLNFDSSAGQVVYESPGTVFSGLEQGSNSGEFTAFGFFQFVGATATFNANTTGSRKIVIAYTDLIVTQVIAAATSDSPAEDLTLSCSGFYPGRFVPGSSPVGYSTFKVIIVWQDSGAALGLTNLKFWVGSL